MKKLRLIRVIISCVAIFMISCTSHKPSRNMMVERRYNVWNRLSKTILPIATRPPSYEDEEYQEYFVCGFREALRSAHANPVSSTPIIHYDWPNDPKRYAWLRGWVSGQAEIDWLVAERVDELKHMIPSIIGQTDQWAYFGGDEFSVTNEDGTLVITTTKYLHKSIDELITTMIRVSARNIHARLSAKPCS